MAVGTSRKKVSLPVARNCTIFNVSRSLPDRNGVNNLTAWLTLCRRFPATSHHAVRSQVREQFFLQDTASLNEKAFIDRLMRHEHRLVAVGEFYF
jgi:hypothetical protein